MSCKGNKIGTRILLWETPTFKEWISEYSSSQCTTKEQFMKKDLRIRYIGKGKKRSLYIRPLCQTRSNAWATLRNIPEYSYFSREEVILSINLCSWWKKRVLVSKAKLHIWNNFFSFSKGFILFRIIFSRILNKVKRTLIGL